jgi:hypothetical protein
MSGDRSDDGGDKAAATLDEPDGRPLWLIKIAVLATRSELGRLTDDLITTICPSPDHDGDCAIPWSLTSITGSSLSSRQQAELRESIRLTNPDPDDFE